MKPYNKKEEFIILDKILEAMRGKNINLSTFVMKNILKILDGVDFNEEISLRDLKKIYVKKA